MMAIVQRQRYCKTCARPTLHSRETLSFGFGCLATLLTAGLFLPFWLLIDLLGIFRPWRCQVCGQGRHT